MRGGDDGDVEIAADRGFELELCELVLAAAGALDGQECATVLAHRVQPSKHPAPRRAALRWRVDGGVLLSARREPSLHDGVDLIRDDIVRIDGQLAQLGSTYIGCGDITYISAKMKNHQFFVIALCRLIQRLDPLDDMNQAI